mgnify:FL=1
MKKKVKIVLLVGTRPNIVKISQFRRVFSQFENFELKIIHSNQHYSESVSSVFFTQFGIEADAILPHYSGNASAHMGHIIEHLTMELMKDIPELLIVVGDVNSTLAGAIVGNKLGVKLAHLESGLRSYDRQMPEEINRIIVDELSDYFFVTEQSGWDNLKEDGKDMNNVFFVGNTMIDSLKAFEKEIHTKKFSFNYDQSKPYLAMTLHRPSNVDNEKGLLKVLALLKHCSQHFQVIFPMHPRTKKNIDLFNLTKDFDDVKEVVYTEPLDYFTFQKLIACADGVITDSGGIQEETTFIGVPCVTLRENTERPITIDIGTNELMNFDPPGILKKLIELGCRKNQVPPLWDGNATQRIAEKLNEIYSA